MMLLIIAPALLGWHLIAHDHVTSGLLCMVLGIASLFVLFQ
jgi:hypothetical protein